MEIIDFKVIKNASVCLRGIEAGVLKKISEEEYTFQYLSKYLALPTAVAISRSLPLQSSLITTKKLHPFFDNLITEGWLLEYTEKIFHIDKSNRFALLMATGKSPIGAVTVEPQDENGKIIDIAKTFQDEEPLEILKTYSNKLSEEFPYCPTCFKKIEDFKPHRKCTLEMWGTIKNIGIELKAENPLQSFARVIYGGSISGAQRKGMFHLDSRKGVLTSTSMKAQYILKPDGDYSELPANEHITMAIAKRAGFNIPPFTLLKIEDMGYIFAIKRFDRTKEGTPLMAEDMGQIIQVPSSDKYESSCESVAKVINKYSSAPIVDLIDFFRRIVFCFIVANADMHLKNWSLLENERALGKFMLSPGYDFLNTRIPIPDEKIDIGLPLVGKSRKLKKADFKQFATHLKLPHALIDKIFSEIPIWHSMIKEIVPLSLLSDDAKKKYLEIVNSRVLSLV